MTDPRFISSPHGHAGGSVGGVMLCVAAALAPGLLVSIWTFGPGAAIQCLLAVAFALGVETLMLALRGRPVPLFLRDGSACVTGLLFALSVPPFTPWWIDLIGIAFAIAIAKHVFGGLGHNPFNPAMAGFAFVLLCFPIEMNTWPAAPGTLAHGAGLVDSLAAVFLPDRGGLDGLSGATALGYMKSKLGTMAMVSEIRDDPIFGQFAGRGWEWVSGAYLAGGLALMALGVIRWQIPVAMTVTVSLIAGVFHAFDPDAYAPPLFHLFGGATLLGAFFIATDPVTAASTPRGRLVYGALIGALTYAIRVFGAYPDGVAFAVLLGNAAVPLIDHCTRPRVLGEPGDAR